MTVHISPKEQKRFQEYGAIAFYDLPFTIPTLPPTTASHRNLWRTQPALKTLLRRHIAPLIAQLLNAPSLRLLCDEHFPPNIALTTCEPHFGFRPITCIASLHPTHLIFYHPSMPKPPEDTYLALFGPINTLYIKKPTDPLYDGSPSGHIPSADACPIFFFSL